MRHARNERLRHAELRRNLLRREHVVHIARLDRAAGHAVEFGRLAALGEHDAPARLTVEMPRVPSVPVPDSTTAIACEAASDASE